MARNTIGNKAVDSTLITGNTTVTAASDDTILISDTSDSGNLKKVLISTITDTLITNSANNRVLTDTGNVGQINAESALTFDGTTLGTNAMTASGVVTAAGFTIGSAAINEAELEILDGATVSTAELNSLASIGSDTVATQLATKAPLASPALTGTATAVNLTLSGNLTVNGTSTIVSSTNTTITDNLLELNSGASSNANDSGILIERGSTGNNAIIAWDESSDGFILGTTTATASDTGDLTIAASPLAVSEISATELDMGDSNKIKLGTGDDLEIFHDGSNSYISDTGTGDLIIKGSDTVFIQNASGVKGAEFWSAGTAQLNYNGSKKFETTNTGISITGVLGTSGDITSGGSFIIGSASMDETDLEKLDGITNGTAAANKAVVLDANKAIATITTATITNLSTTTLTGGAITSSNFAGVTTLLIKNSAGTTLKTMRGPSS